MKKAPPFCSFIKKLYLCSKMSCTSMQITQVCRNQNSCQLITSFLNFPHKLFIISGLWDYSKNNSLFLNIAIPTGNIRWPPIFRDWRNIRQSSATQSTRAKPSRPPDGADRGQLKATKQKSPPRLLSKGFAKNGGYLLSRGCAVPSARAGLTSLFGMGRGGTLPL